MWRDGQGAVAAAAREALIAPEAMGPVVDEVRRRLRGEVDEPRVRDVIEDLLRGDFANASVTAYLPILLARRACEVLRADAADGGGAR